LGGGLAGKARIFYKLFVSFDLQRSIEHPKNSITQSISLLFGEKQDNSFSQTKF